MPPLTATLGKSIFEGNFAAIARIQRRLSAVRWNDLLGTALFHLQI